LNSNFTINSIVDKTLRIADALARIAEVVRGPAADILALTFYLPVEQRQDLLENAKLLCDNVSREVLVYSFLSDWVRKLEPHAAGCERFGELKITVFGD